LPLNFGVHLPTHGAYRYSDILKASVVADALGYDSLWVGDHFYLPKEVYGKIGGDPNRPDKLDAWTLLAAVAGQTGKIRLGTRVSPLPFYAPARLAKTVTTVDIISRGRVNFGVGAGWFPEEAFSYGIDWGSHRERISQMLECLEVILELWKENRANYNGKYYSLHNAPFWPKPVQKPHPPIWFGGSSRAILEAAVKYGDGVLFPSDLSLEKFGELVKEIVEISKRYGRRRKVLLVCSLSYPDGLGEKPSEWITKTQLYGKWGADSVLIDFSQADVPPNKAITVLKKFSKIVFPNKVSLNLSN